MPHETIIQEKHDGMEQIFKVMEIYINGNGITPEQFEQEKAHYLGLPVTPPTKEKVELIEITRNKKEVDDFYQSLDVIPLAIEKVKAALASIGLEAVPTKTSINSSLSE